MKKVMLGLTSMFGVLLTAASAFAQEVGDNQFSVNANAVLGAGIVLGIAALGGALGQGRAAAAALTGIARNPNASGKLFVPMILGLALIESLVLFAFVMGFMILGNVVIAE